MSEELEVRLADAFGLVGPTVRATDSARQAVLATIPAPPRRSRRRSLSMGCLVAATVTAGVGAAASGRLPVLQSSAPPAPPVPDLTVPAGAPGAVALVDGRAWVVAADGHRVSRRATAVELSPAGLFVAFGHRDRMVVTELDGDERWHVRTSGPVEAIAWAPYPTYIAYVARRGRARDLHVIWANGRADRVIARHVAPARPRWRADTGGLTYVTASGRRATWTR